ncbi:MAG: NAD-dependent epimerase [Halioglobus sp.]|nr:NAD-dependent epimerase [Halioglobus sp.]
MRILITGTAGFIGSALALRLLADGHAVLGIDNHNDYYDLALKQARVDRLESYADYSHLRTDLINREAIERAFQNFRPDAVVNLAAQAGVRYSIHNPGAYIESNIVGFSNVLEICRKFNVEHLVYASSSSVYGANQKVPFATHDHVDHPLSLYAATKRSNELMAHAYSNLFALPTTGLRFFTVYGPWGRPDMALFKFTKSILEGRPIQLFNQGQHRRDFTYIDDVIECVARVLRQKSTPNQAWVGRAPDPATSFCPWRVYNIGSSKQVNLMAYVKAIESELGMEAIIERLPMQPGDVHETHADVADFVKDFGYRPQTLIEDGVRKFIAWYKTYFKL